jgi:Ca-activated chloride channel family protein
MGMEITFANPLYLWFMIAIPLMIFAHFVSLRFIRRKALKFANFPAIEYVTGERLFSKNYVLLIMRLATLFLIILSVSGATLWYEGMASDTDFILAIDASGSMLATDFQPSRLEAAKNAALLFTSSIEDERSVGVLSFAGVSFLKQTPTNNIAEVKDAIKNVSVELAGGTAIGTAIISSVNLLTEPAKARVIILITDGQNNVGPTVEEAIDYANENHVAVYTIGIGTEQGGGFPEMNLSFLSKLDAKTLQKIATETKGRYYEARNEEELSEIYEEIATSNMSKLSVNIALIFLVAALIMLFAEWGLINTKYRTLP